MREIVPGVKGFRRSLCSVFSVTLLGAVGAESNYNNHNHYSQNSPYLYSEIQSVDFETIYNDGDSSSGAADEARRNPLNNGEGRDQGQAPHGNMPPSFDFSVSDVDTEYHEDPVSIVASSVLYDGDCDVSMEAMMCHGGGLDNLMDRFMDYDELFEYDDEDISEDDDEDDDNDGHSSMLSNASLRRSRSTRTERTRSHSSSGNTKSKTEPTAHMNKVVRLENKVQTKLSRIENQVKKEERNQLHRSFVVQERRTPVPFLRD